MKEDAPYDAARPRLGGGKRAEAEGDSRRERDNTINDGKERHFMPVSACQSQKHDDESMTNKYRNKMIQAMATSCEWWGRL